MTKAFKWSILCTIYRLVYNNMKNNIIYVRASCWASYKRNVKYEMKMICNQSGTPKILAAKCDRQLSGNGLYFSLSISLLFRSWKKGNGFALFAELSLTFSRAVFHDIGDSEQGLIKFQNAIKTR